MATTKENQAVKEENKGLSIEEYNNERVPFTLHAPHYIKGDAHANVTVNGTVYRVKYGEEVFVPRFVKEAIENSLKAKAILSNRQNELEKLAAKTNNM